MIESDKDKPPREKEVYFRRCFGNKMKKEQVYDTLINNLPIGFSVIDKDGVTIDFNHTAEKITGYLKKEVIGKSHLDIFHRVADKASCPLLANVLLGGRLAHR